MKKRSPKLKLHRDTVHRLDPRDLGEADLRGARGGIDEPAERKKPATLATKCTCI